MTDRPDTPQLEGWPDDPAVTYNPERTQVAPSPGDASAGRDDGPVAADLAAWALVRPDAQPPATMERPVYRLGRIVGTGGFGEVWQAVQVSLGRVVALKRPRRGAALPDRLTAATARLGAHLFRQEALVTAQLDHPNIVPVHDIGVDGEGEPVLAMKFVEGRLWTDLIEEQLQALPVTEFLARNLPILVSVAQAVAYAHAHGVVHRDIKPGQVMVGEFGEVFLTDWGLAVRLAPATPDQVREAPAPVACPAGTAAYMAPEQTEPNADRIGPWTDVYLLGGTLYTLLTGQTPHPSSSTTIAFGMAQEGYVPPLREAAAGREVPPELAALAERCLAPNPEDRPASARAFVQELQGYLSGAGRRRESETLIAEAERRLAEETTSYRDFGDLLSLLGRSRALWPENPALDPVTDRALGAWTRAALGSGDLVLARVQAERVHDPAARDALVADVEVAVRREAREQRQRRWAFAAAAALLVLLGVGALIHARSMAAARDRAEKALRAEAEAHAQVVDLLNFLLGDLREGLAPIGRLSLLERVADKAFEQLRKLPPGQMPDAALTQRARALETLGDVLAARGSETDAGIAWREALAIREGLVTRDPADITRQRELASSLLSVSRTVESEGNLAGALALARRAAEVRDRMATHPGADSVVLERARAAGRHRIADLLEISGDLPAALAEHRAALAIYEACLARAPGDVEARRDRAVARSRVGDLLAALGDTRAALAEYRAYASEIGALQASDPHHAELIRELAVAHNSVGWALRSLGDLRGALVELETQRDLAARLVERDPSNAAWRVDLAQARAAVGQVLVALGRRSEALAELTAGASEMERVAAADPANRGARRDAAIARGLVAKALLAFGRPSEAAEVLRGPLAVLETLTAADPGNAAWQADLARLKAWQAQASVHGGGAKR